MKGAAFAARVYAVRSVFAGPIALLMTLLIARLSLRQ